MANLHKYMFRKYDIRGLVNDEQLNTNSLEIIGKAFGTYLQSKGISRCVMGHDSRSYAPKLKNALVVGILSTGIHIIDLGMVTTPCSYFAQHHFNSPAGVMITASHNPNGWSGVKLSAALSESLAAEEIQQVYNLTKSEEFHTAQGSYERSPVKEAYLQDMAKRVNMKKPLKIVLNAGNAIAGIFAPPIFKQLGFDVVEQYCELDNTFPHHEPDPENKACKEALAKEVLRTGADLGIAYDGDGDRIGCVDNKGRNVWSDKILIFLARQVLQRKPGSSIVFDVKCTQVLADDIAQHGGIPIMHKTGHSFIKAKLKETNAALAGERSGHMFFTENWYGFDDAIYASLRLVEFLTNQDKPFSELLDELPQTVNTPTYYIECNDEVKWEVIPKVVADLKQLGYEVIDIDGARVKFPKGFGCVRVSSTQPALTASFEADTEENLNKYKDTFREILNKYPEISQDWGRD